MTSASALKKLPDALLHAEQRNLLAQRMAADFAERVRDKKVPDMVVSFLQGPWAQVVAESQLQCADGTVDTDGYLGLVDDLIWSVQLRLARRNRAKLVDMVPGMLVKMRQGLQLISYPEERIPVFFDALITYHEKAFEVARTGPLEEAGVAGHDSVLASTDSTGSDARGCDVDGQRRGRRFRLSARQLTADARRRGCPGGARRRQRAGLDGAEPGHRFVGGSGTGWRSGCAPSLPGPARTAPCSCSFQVAAWRIPCRAAPWTGCAPWA